MIGLPGPVPARRGNNGPHAGEQQATLGRDARPMSLAPHGYEDADSRNHHRYH